MPVSPLAYLRHIIAETAYPIERTEGVTKDDFLRDETLTRACIRSPEVIGEAARSVPEDLKRRNSHVQWREMAGMRDRLIHGYFSVDYEIVWDAVTNKVPELHREVTRIIAEEFRGAEL